MIPPRWTYLKELSAVTLPKINKFIAGSDAKTSEKWQVFFGFCFFFPYLGYSGITCCPHLAAPVLELGVALGTWGERREGQGPLDS